MTRVILSLQATHTALEALRRSENACAVAAQVTEKRHAGTKPEGLPFLSYGSSAVVAFGDSWLPMGGTTFVDGIYALNPGKDLCSHPFLALDPSSMQEGGP